MLENFLIVNKAILPDYYEKVVEARNLVNDGMGVSEAVKIVGISRSTYYKYKEYIFVPQANATGRRAIVSLLLMHEKGILSEVLNDISNLNINILSISQSIPLNQKASVEISMDITDMMESIDELLSRLENLDGVVRAFLIAIE